MSTPALVQRVRQWLMRTPRPAYVRIIQAHGAAPELFVVPERPRWATIAEDLLSLSPTALHALDENESMLRVENLGNAATDEGEEETPSYAEIPVPVPVSTDPSMQMLSHFANLLARAHEVSGRESRAFVRDCVSLLLKRTESVEQRLERTEAAWRSEFQARIEEKLNTVEDDDMRSEMAKLFFGGAGNQSSPSNGAPQHPPQAPKGWS